MCDYKTSPYCCQTVISDGLKFIAIEEAFVYYIIAHWFTSCCGHLNLLNQRFVHLFLFIDMNNCPRNFLSSILICAFLFTVLGCGSQKPDQEEVTPMPVSPPSPVIQPFAKFTSVIGNVSVMKAGTLDKVKAEVGMMLDKNDTVQTVADSKATIIFFEGSVIDVDGVTEIKIAELAVNQSTGSTTIRIRQEVGKTVTRVEKLVDPASRYDIETPAGSIIIRGSQGIVIVLPNGTTNVQNIEGIWCVRAMQREVCIPGGMSNTTVPGQPPGPPVPPNPPTWPPPKAPPSQSDPGIPPVPPSPPVLWRTWTQTSASDFNGGSSDNVSITSVAGDGTITLAQNLFKDQYMEEIDGNYSMFWGSQYLAQVFTAGLNASLVKVDLNLWKNQGGNPASLVVELRNSVDIGGNVYAPGHLILDAIIVPATAISDFEGAVYQLSFPVPFILSSGTRYAIVVHQLGNGGSNEDSYGWLLISYGSDQYSGGASWYSNNSGLNWMETGTSPEDYYFATYVAPYAPLGTFISSAFDTGKLSVFGMFSWFSVVPAGTTIKFQIASNNDNTTWNFVGPDGTPSTYYQSSGATIMGHDGRRYIKYKAFLSTTNTGITPMLNSVTIQYR